MEEYSQAIVDNIKHEPERHFLLILPDYPEATEIQQQNIKERNLVIRLKKFDKKWILKAELLESYFTCDKCRYATRKMYKLTRHTRDSCRLMPENEIQCKRCSNNNQPKLESEKMFKCPYCHEEFLCFKCRSKHEKRTHFNGTSWQCIECPYNAKVKLYLRNHYRTHAKSFSCETCKQMFSSKTLLNLHQQQHRHGLFAAKPVKFDCTKCSSSFATRKNLGDHMRNVHSQQVYECDICGKKVKSKPIFRYHMDIHIKIPCSICHRKIPPYALKSHIKAHQEKGKKFLHSPEKHSQLKSRKQ